MNSTRLSRSFSCSTAAFPPQASFSDSGHSFGRSRDRDYTFGIGIEPRGGRKSHLKTNSSLSLRRMSTFARFLRKSTSDGNKVYKGKLVKATKGPCGPEWISSPRDYTSCTLCDRFFVSGEDWLEHYGQCVEERELGVKVESTPTTSAGSALASASKAEEPYCEKCDRYFTTNSALYHHRSDVHPGSVPMDLCPICNVTCSLEEHLKRAVMHRNVPNPSNDAELGDIWPRCCFACDETFDNIEDMKVHNRFLRRHNRIMHERQAETSADEWQSYCWPCDRYFASEAELGIHHRNCSSPLKLMTYIEGELLTAARMKRDDDSLVEETLEATYLASLPSLRNTDEEHSRVFIESPASEPSTPPVTHETRTQAALERGENSSFRSHLGLDISSRRMSLAPIPSLSPLNLDPPETSGSQTTLATPHRERDQASSSTAHATSSPQSPKSPRSPRSPPPIPPKPVRPKTSPSNKPAIPTRPSRPPPPTPPPIPRRSASRPPSRPSTPGVISLPGSAGSASGLTEPPPSTQSLEAILRDIPPPPPLYQSQSTQSSIPLLLTPSSSRSANESRNNLLSPPSPSSATIAPSRSEDELSSTFASDHDSELPAAMSRLRVHSMVDLMPPKNPRHSRRLSLAASIAVAPAAYECPLCFEVEDALSNIPCGHVFCTSCISEVLKREPLCPLCRAEAKPADMRKVFLNT